MSRDQHSTTRATGSWPRRLWGGLGAVVTAVVLACAVPASTAAIVQVTGPTDAAHRVEERTIEQPVESVSVVADAGDVAVRGTSSDRAQVRLDMHFGVDGSGAGAGVDHGSRLTLRSQCAARCRAAHSLAVPQEVDVQMIAMDGTQNVSGISGELTLSAGSADTVLDEVSGAVEVVNESGWVRGTGLRSEQVSVQGGSPTVDLSFAELPQSVEVSLDSGSTTIELPADTDAGRCTVETETDGEVVVDLPEAAAEGASRETDDASGADCELRLTSGGGDITVTGADGEPFPTPRRD